MLFEPCGDLRKDYGAYCETLRLTEREDLYSAVHTSEELEAARATQLSVISAGSSRQSPELMSGRMGLAAVTEGDGAGAADSHSASASHTLGPFGHAGADVVPAAAAQPASATTAAAAADDKGKKSARKAPPPPQPAAAAAPGTTKAEAQPTDVAEVDEGPHLVERPNLFFLRLRHPSFCINQRDITPLCRAIPHCPSLVSIELVGCGLSVESYLLLVEAVFKSRRVVAITVDFNDLVRPGFLKDPTALPPPGPSSRQTSLASANAAAHGEDGTGTPGEHTPPPSVDVTPRSSSASARQKKKRTTKMSAASAVAEAAAAAAAAMLAKEPDEPGAVYLKPTEFCGLHVLRSPLEEQIQEEREKKGKVDPKKLSMLQQQTDTINALNVAHRIKLPRSWEGMLYTSVRHLSLRGNNISDDVVEKMIDVLLQHPYSQLISLNLWGNAITDKGATLLAQWLREKDRRLRTLDLGRNRISDVGLLELVDVFRMHELASMEEVAAYRQRVLTRPGASAQERAAASQPMPAAYPSYQELFNSWFIATYPEAAEEVVAAATAAATGLTAVAANSSTKGGKDGNASTVGGASSLAAGASAGGKRAAAGAGAGAKGKSAKMAAEVLPTLARPVTPFDRHCVRVPTGPTESVIRVPGNTVLEMLNLCENLLITPYGAQEAVRRLRLHEPTTDGEMVAMAGASFHAAFAADPQDTAVGGSETAQSPDRTSRLVSLDMGNNSTSTAVATDAEVTLARPIPTGASRSRTSDVSPTASATSPTRRRTSSGKNGGPRTSRSSSSGATTRKDGTGNGKSPSLSPRTSTSPGRNLSTSVSSPGAAHGAHQARSPTAAQVTTPELHCADVRLRSFGLFTRRYDTAPAAADSSDDTPSMGPQPGSVGRPAFDSSTASTAIYGGATPVRTTGGARGGGGGAAGSGEPRQRAEWLFFAQLQDSMNDALNDWYVASVAAAGPAGPTTAAGGAAAADEEGKGKKHGGLGNSVRPGSSKEKRAASPS